MPILNDGKKEVHMYVYVYVYVYLFLLYIIPGSPPSAEMLALTWPSLLSCSRCQPLRPAQFRFADLLSVSGVTNEVTHAWVRNLSGRLGVTGCVAS